MLKANLKLPIFTLIISCLNFIFFHFPFFSFVFKNTDFKSFNGFLLISSLFILMIIANYLAFLLFLYLLKYIGKIIIAISFIISAIAVYFINTYSVIIDESMISNVFNTNYEESSSFISIKFFIYLIFLGIIPAIWILKTKKISITFKKFSILTGSSLVIILLLSFANASNWLWVDKNSKTLGGLAMPWSYSVNTSLLLIHNHDKNKKEIPLPNARIGDNKKSVVVLVIGESARKENFSLYGYNKNTNPLLTGVKNLNVFNATSCATYTTAGVKCILEHTNSSKLYEILPNYLYRNNVDVVWKTTNWGEPPVHIKDYENKDFLQSHCKGENCGYDEVLLENLNERILSSKKNKILIVLHTSTSHGPTYSKKYPPKFEKFKPVCNSVELGKCSQEELVNAYDNTIVYTDYLLYNVIEDLQQLKDYNSAMIYVSDHGESLGEKNLYMHGVPLSIAPKDQFEIPFIVWTSENSKQVKNEKQLTQNNVFHSVLNFLNIKSPIYDENINIFK